MSKHYEILGLLCATALVLPATAYADDTLTDALTGGKVSGDFRLRYENVDVVSPTVKDATALTLRSRLGYETAQFYGFSALLEFQDTHVLDGEDNYSPEYKDPTKAASAPYDYAAIVDPEQTDVDRAYLRYRGIPKLDLGLGRQLILLDDQRFVGPVQWRQNEQTFDAFTANYAGVQDWDIYYAYIDKVKGIADVTPTYNFDLNSSDNLFNVSYSGFALGKISTYGYFLNNEEPSAELRNVAPDVNELNPSLRYKSNDTYGARFDGKYALPTSLPLHLFYTAEYAKQDLVNPTNMKFNTKYSLAEVGIGYLTGMGLVSGKVAEEVLGSDDGLQGFQTPYATKHTFNGWADMFLSTPNSGLRDKYATLASDLQPYGVKLMAMYHDFSQDEGSGSFGTEWDLQALKQFGPHYTLGVKYASYKADSDIASINAATPNIDTKKFWLWGEFKF